MNKNQKIVFALLAGVAAGALAAVLLAPENGKNTRSKLAELAEDLLDGLSNKTNQEATEHESEETTLGI